MIKKRRKQLIYFYVMSDIAAIILSFVTTFLLRFYSGLIGVPKGIPHYGKYFLVLPFLIVVQVLYFSYMGYYKIKLRRNRLDDLFLVFFNTVLSVVVILLIFSYLRSYEHIDFQVSHLFLFLYIPFSVLTIFGFRLLIFSLFKRSFLKNNGISRVLIAGTGEIGIMMGENLSRYKHFGIDVVGYLSEEEGGDRVLGRYGDLKKIVRRHGVTDLFIALSMKNFSTITRLIESANNLLIDVKLVPDIVYMSSLGSGMEHIEGLPVINLGEIPLSGWRLFLKNMFDLIFGCAALLVALIPMIGIGLMIKLSSRGPVFYRQLRMGVSGRTFRIIKFRTMIRDAEKDTGVIWSPPDDERITVIGKILRKFSLDELPQLINVIKGDMSLVGPRPERPELVEKFREDIPRYMLRHTVKPGMTGWAQVHGLRGNTPLSKRIEFDIFYIQNWDMKLDFEILWRTILKFQFIDPNN
jgi:Undecaprenyl-phosphate glucose phosphotransferase